MRYILIVILIFSIGTVNSQSLYENFELEESNFFYQDSANGEDALGDYEPTDLIELNDGSLLVSTEFSISFPSQYKTPEKYDSIYFERSKVYQEKSHVSSGSVFKLNKELKKEWEIVFKERRVNSIHYSHDNRILIVGEEVQMKHFWISEINAKGEILWTKFYKHRNQVSIANTFLDKNNELYILIEAEKMIPIRIRSYYGRKRIEFFKNTDMVPDIALMKISIDGKKRWTKTIDNRRKTGKFGYELIVSDSLIFVTSSFEGFKKRKGEYEKFEGKQLSILNKKGRLINQNDISGRDILFFQNELYSITSYTGDTLVIYKGNDKYDSIRISSADRDVRIESIINGENGKLILASNHDNNRDYLLIRLSNSFKFDDYWTYPRAEYNEIRGAVELKDGSIILVGKCYKRMEGTSNELTTYINLVKLKNGA